MSPVYPQTPRRKEYRVCVRCGQEGHLSESCTQPNPAGVPPPPPGLPKYQQDHLNKTKPK